MPSDPSPEPKPLTVTISSGSFSDRRRVQLFSSPQQTQASSTSSEPGEKRRLSVPSTESRMLARVISPMAAHSRREMASPKMNRAMMEVATISKLFSSEALAAVVRLSPSMRKIGAAMSSATMPAT